MLVNLLNAKILIDFIDIIKDSLKPFRCRIVFEPFRSSSVNTHTRLSPEAAAISVFDDIFTSMPKDCDLSSKWESKL